MGLADSGWSLENDLVAPVELLGQLGEAAIDAFDEAMASAMRHPEEDDALSAFVLGYVRFARDEPALYELLFGRRIWSSNEASDFQRKARHSFRVQSERLLQLQRLGVLPAHANPLRLAQVAWATLHGLCCMYNDGLAFTAETIEECQTHIDHSRERLREWMQHKGMPVTESMLDMLMEERT